MRENRGWMIFLATGWGVLSSLNAKASQVIEVIPSPVATRSCQMFTESHPSALPQPVVVDRVGSKVSWSHHTQQRHPSTAVSSVMHLAGSVLPVGVEIRHEVARVHAIDRVEESGSTVMVSASPERLPTLIGQALFTQAFWRDTHSFTTDFAIYHSQRQALQAQRQILAESRERLAPNNQRARKVLGQKIAAVEQSLSQLNKEYEAVKYGPRSNAVERVAAFFAEVVYLLSQPDTGRYASIDVESWEGIRTTAVPVPHAEVSYELGHWQVDLSEQLWPDQLLLQDDGFYYAPTVSLVRKLFYDTSFEMRREFIPVLYHACRQMVLDLYADETERRHFAHPDVRPHNERLSTLILEHLRASNLRYLLPRLYAPGQDNPLAAI